MNQAGRCELIVAILTYDCFDEWLEDIGVSIESFCQEMMGTWQFNYIQALQSEGIRCILFFTTSKVDRPKRYIHKPTGAVICLLPYSRVHRCVSKSLHRVSPTTRSLSVGYFKRVLRGILGLIASYLSTPLVLLSRELRREGCDCILVEQYEEPRFDLTVILGRIIGVPVFGIFAALAASQNWWRRPFRFLALRLCAGLVICGGAEAKRIVERYGFPKRKIGRIYYPVDLSIWYPSARTKSRALLGIPADAKVAIYHGRIELWTKGLDILVDAWDLICRDRPTEELRLILIGTGFDAQRFSEILSIRQLRGVEWLNQWVHDRNAIRHYLSGADVYVFPSRVDAFPNAVMEAMACGLPIVAASAPGIADILNDGERSGGLVVPTGDARALAGAIERVLFDAKLASDLGKAARSRVQAVFSFDAVGQQLRQFLSRDQTDRSWAVRV